MNPQKPSHVAENISRIATSIENSLNPSAVKIAHEIGMVLLAMGPIPGAPTSFEGELGLPVPEVVAHLQKWLGAKYAIDIAYRSFADRVKGPWRDSLVDHWHTHSKEERQHAYDLAMRISGFGADPAQVTVQVPSVQPGLQEFIQTLAAMELEAIEAGRHAIAISGNHTSLKVMAENFVLVDTAHLDDLRRMSAEIGQ